MNQPTIYIITNTYNTTLYIGVTSKLKQRIYQHKNKLVDGFSAKYNLNKLVYFELHTDMENAILREKQLKKWKRAWKERLVNEMNYDWVDLYLKL